MQLGRLFQNSRQLILLSAFELGDKLVLQVVSNVKDALTSISYVRHEKDNKRENKGNG